MNELCYYIFPTIMQAPHMLYIQENKSVNTTRVFRTHSLPEALETMIKLVAQIKLKDKAETSFDLEEAINYFEGVHELRYFEELPSDSNNQHIFGQCEVKNMKIFTRKMLLDELVDRIAALHNHDMCIQPQQ